MDLKFMLEAFIILLVGFCLLRITGKKTVGEMTGLEIITLLAMASVIGHAVSGKGLWKTAITLCVFAALLITIQFLAVKFDRIEKLFMGKATIVIQDGNIIPANLKKLRFSVDQLEAKLREKGISSVSDVKTAAIEMSGELGYELFRHAKPVTIGELEVMLASLLPSPPPQPVKPKENLFTEILHEGHDDKTISPKLD